MASKSDLLVWVEHEQICVVHCSTSGNVQKLRIKAKPVCLTVHPSDDLIAVGDADGAISVFSAPFNQSAAMKLHWHTLPVGDLYLSSNYLYSAGAEGVLVRWDLESDDRQFLPRLGMPVKYVSVSHNEKYVVCHHSDNTITVIEAPNKTSCVIQGLVQRSYFNDQPSDLGMIYDPHGHLVVSGRPGQLQFFDLKRERQEKIIDVTGENLATDFKLQFHMMKGINSEVILADFSPDGLYLATVEYKSALSTMCKLKFWKWNEQANQYEINTNVLMPHLGHQLRACKIAYVNEQYFCITTAHKSFKIWTIVDGGESTFWQCIEEHDFRSLTCNLVALSEDNSILAVSFNHMMTLWQLGESSLQMLAEICAKGEPQPITAMEFGRFSSSNLLLTATNRSLNAWDLLSLDRLWSSPVTVKQLIVDSKSERMAAITIRPEKKVIVFQAEKGIEAAICETDISNEDQIRCGLFVPQKLQRCSEISWQSNSSLLLMGKRDKLFHLVYKKDAVEVTDRDTLKAATNIESLLTPFGSHLLAERRIYDKNFSLTSKGDLQINDDGVVIEKLLQTPSHVLPSAKLLVEGYLRAFLDIDDKDDEPEMMEVDQGEKTKDSDSDEEELPNKKIKSEPIEKEVDLIEKMQIECRLERLKLAKLKDYTWLEEVLKK